MDSGKLIRELREERFVKSTDIERISRSIASDKGNADFYVSHSTLADVETGSVPSIHKLFSLAACLKVSLEKLLLVFGIDANELRQFIGQSEPGLRAPAAIEAREPGFHFQLSFSSCCLNQPCNGPEKETQQSRQACARPHEACSSAARSLALDLPRSGPAVCRDRADPPPASSLGTGRR